MGFLPDLSPVQPDLRVGAPWENKSGPEGASTPESPGLTAATTRRNRGAMAVPSMPRPTTGAPTPPPNCPVCTEPATHWGTNSERGVTTGNYLCSNEHGWLTKWVTF